MNATAPHALAQRSGFTLIEMIGVLAIMAILAAVITPNALRTLDRAAVRAEADTLHNLGEQTKNFLKTNGWAPGLKPTAPIPSWDVDLGTFSDISPADILTNKREMARSFIYEPGVFPPRRALILSSMRAGLALPVAANLGTTPLFDNVWNTADGSVPPTGTSWTGWAAWRNTLNGAAGEYLVIQRVNFTPTFNADLQAEIDILQMLAEQAKLSLRDTETTLLTTNWVALLAPYVALSATDILYNRYQSQTGTITRLYVQDITNQRGMFFSSAAPGVALPSSANISNYFNNIWNTPAGNVPGTYAGLPAAGWGAWNASNISQLIIQRVDFTPVYATDLRGIPVKLTGAAGGYRLVRPNGTYTQGTTPTPPTVPLNAHPNFRLDLYRETGCANLVFSQPITTAAELDFNGSTWTMKQP